MHDPLIFKSVLMEKWETFVCSTFLADQLEREREREREPRIISCQLFTRFLRLWREKIK